MNDDAFGHWLAGFLDGEGCFDIACQRHRRDTRGYEYHYCRLSVTLRADDRDLLYECAERWGGHVYVAARTNVPPTHHPKARWEVSARSDLRQIAALLKRCPLHSKKARAFAIWCRALAVSSSMAVDRHDQLATLRAELMRGRAYVEGGDAHELKVA